MTIEKEQLQALLLDVLQGYNITPRFANETEKLLGYHQLAHTLAGILVDVGRDQLPSAAEAKSRIADSWNRLVNERQAAIQEAIQADINKLHAAQAEFQAMQRAAAKASSGVPPGHNPETWANFKQ